jgi:hypothetical protein
VTKIYVVTCLVLSYIEANKSHWLAGSKSLVGLFIGGGKAQLDESSKVRRDGKRLPCVGRNKRGQRRQILLSISESFSYSYAAHYAVSTSLIDHAQGRVYGLNMKEDLRSQDMISLVIRTYPMREFEPSRSLFLAVSESTQKN